ncbi:MAG: NINE protein [Eudoraea sp.]|nr:NINE protein [Eudoraea sp.]
MSDETNDLGDQAEDAFDKAKEKASEFADDAKEKASEFADDAKESASEFADEAKKTANEFAEGIKNAGGDNKKILAGILAIILGSLGIHKFVLGYQKEGFILLAVTIIGWVLMCVGIGVFLVWITGLIGLIEGIIYLTKSDEEFFNTYQAGQKPWF